MLNHENVTNVLCVGIGGQGVLMAMEVLAQAAFAEGYDVKKSEVHGMAQRGGSVTSAVRFGPRVHSPLIGNGEADILLGFDPVETERNRHQLRAGGKLILPPEDLELRLPHPRTLNVALLGYIAPLLSISDDSWDKAIAACVPPKTVDINIQAFRLVRQMTTVE